MSDYPSTFTQMNPETQRKRALAKVYSLLIELAEEAEMLTSSQEEKIEPPSQDKCDVPELEVLNSDR